MLDPLYCSEAWDLLRETQHLTLHRHYIGEQEPLALLLCPSVCRALHYLVQKSNKNVGRSLHHEKLICTFANANYACSYTRPSITMDNIPAP